MRDVLRGDPALPHPRVVVAEHDTFQDREDLLLAHGVDVEALRAEACVAMVRIFIAQRPEVWYEAIGDAIPDGT